MLRIGEVYNREKIYLTDWHSIAEVAFIEAITWYNELSNLTGITLVREVNDV